MNISGSPVSLDRFLEIRLAAQKRWTAPASAPKAAVAAKAPAVRAATQDSGLISVYGLNRTLTSRFSETGSAETMANNRHLGTFFDKTA